VKPHRHTFGESGTPQDEKGFVMANPKRRHSKRRTATRRAHDFLKAKSVSHCPNCHEAKLPHRACPKCGHYKDREVLEVEKAS
jgi:large subunit ribosomal protein L32